MCRSLLLVVFLVLIGWPLVAEEKNLPPERHPVLVFEEKDIPALKERIKREPYAAWWKCVLAGCDGALDAITYEPQKCKLAKSLAFAHVMTGKEEYAVKCLEVFHKIKLKEDGGDWSEKFLPEPEGAADLAQAYDMIHGWLTAKSEKSSTGAPPVPEPADAPKQDDSSSSLDPPTPDSELRTANSELDFVRRFLYRFGLYIRNRAEGWYVFHFNNHQTRHYSGLAIVAFALADARYEEPYPAEWYYKCAGPWVDSTYKYQTTTDGAWAEGHNYFSYSAALHLSYFFAARNFLGVDHFAREDVRKSHQWSVLSRMPDGLRPNFDDAALSYFPTHYLTSAVKDAGLFRWDWDNLAAKNWVGFSPVDAICWYDDSVKAAPPKQGPCLFFGEGGDAIFRSDWGPEAVYLNARAEHGKARTNGGGHEHPDETSFILHAFGQLLALDSGYIYWEQRHKVYQADNHNLVLVDGKGPRTFEFGAAAKQVGGDAFLKNTLVRDKVAYCEIHTSYQGVSVKRAIIFVNSRFFIILDELTGETEHKYKLLLHGNGGGDTGGTFKLLADGGQWEIGGVALRASVFSTAPAVKFRHKLDIHSLNYGEEKKHEVLTAEIKGRNAMFVSVLWPARAGEVVPRISAEKSGTRLLVTVESSTACTFEVSSSGQMTLVVTTAGGAPDRVLVRDGTSVR